MASTGRPEAGAANLREDPMPIYEYKCQQCGARTEALQKMADPRLTTCEKCGGALTRLISSPSVQFKGSGWYVTDYARRSGGGGSGKEGGGSWEGGEGGKSEGTASGAEGKSDKSGAAASGGESGGSNAGSASSGGGGGDGGSGTATGGGGAGAAKTKAD
jgi:putative FmdB family regulatory protein